MKKEDLRKVVIIRPAPSRGGVPEQRTNGLFHEWYTKTDVNGNLLCAVIELENGEIKIYSTEGFKIQFID
ncbi:hypothetical protein [Olleya marilimosa]|uniref:Uncharacterized protein n=1 Tax=Olleya marilimosa TaxID=272164 RepID=A0ABR8LP28_9FLAO|nr:hypothetical protein [Olleya marilimosa]MBD3861977.1 hypothetical protein [Olleya marilimosa]